MGYSTGTKSGTEWRSNNLGDSPLINSGRLNFGGVTAAFGAFDRQGSGMRAVLGDGSALATFRCAVLVLNTAAVAAGAGEIIYGATVAATVGAAGAAAVLPANPVGYVIINVAGTQMKVPYYNT